MTLDDRRRWLRRACGLLGGFAGAGLAGAAPVGAFTRAADSPARLRGLSLSSFSMRDRMRWRWGTRGDGPMDLFTFFDFAAELGIEAVEPTSYFFPRPIGAAWISRLRRHAHVLGLDVSSAAMGNDFSWPPDSDRGRENLAYARAWIDRFADLGAPAVRVFASRKPPPGQTAEAASANVVANLETVLPYAERRGVILGLENHDITRDLDLLLRIVRQVDSAWLGVLWDSGNLPATAEPYAQLARIAPHAVVAQIKEAIPHNGEPRPADYRRLVETLVAARYAGYLVFEYEGDEAPEAAIPRELSRLRAAINAARADVASDLVPSR